MVYESTYYGLCSLGDSVTHHGIKGQKWGVRRFQNSDGTLTEAGKKRYRDNFNYLRIRNNEIREEKIRERRKNLYRAYHIDKNADLLKPYYQKVKQADSEITKYVDDYAKTANSKSFSDDLQTGLDFWYPIKQPKASSGAPISYSDADNDEVHRFMKAEYADAIKTGRDIKLTNAFGIAYHAHQMADSHNYNRLYYNWVNADREYSNKAKKLARHEIATSGDKAVAEIFNIDFAFSSKSKDKKYLDYVASEIEYRCEEKYGR